MILHLDQFFVCGNPLFPYIRYVLQNPNIEIGAVYRISDLPDHSESVMKNALQKIDSDMQGKDRVEILQLCRGTGFYLYEVTNMEQMIALQELSEIGMRIVNDDGRTPRIRMGATYTVSHFPTDDRKDQVIEKLKQLDVDRLQEVLEHDSFTFLNDHYMRNHALMILIGLGCIVTEVNT